MASQEKVSVEELSSLLFDDYSEEKEEELKNIINDDGNEPGEKTVDESIIDENPTPDVQTGDVHNDELTGLVSSLINTGRWNDYQVEYNGTVYESIVDLAEKEGITPELFQDLIDKQQEKKLSTITDNSISLGDVDDSKKDLLLAIASGLNDYKPFVDTYNDIIKPLQALDLSDSKTASALIAKYYREVEGWEEDYIKYKINSHKTNLEIEEVADDIRNKYVEDYQTQLQEQKKKEEEEAQTFQQRKQQEMDGFKSYLKSEKYDDPFIARAVPIIFDEENGLPHWALMIAEKLQDNEFKAKFTHWLLDEPDYINKNMAEMKRIEKLKTINTLNLLSEAKSKQPGEKGKQSNILPIIGKNKQ